MKQICTTAILLLTMATAIAQPKPGGKKTAGLANAKDSLSYALGVSIMQNLKKQGLDDINPTVLANAIRNEQLKKPHLIAPETCGPVIGQSMQRQQAKKISLNKAAGVAFLQANAKKEGVMSLPSGLQYQVMKQGEGPKPVPTDRVKCHYHGTLTDGTVFESSVNRGEPVTFAVNGVISGWMEALQLMPVGSKWKLFIPSNLAYGDNPSGPLIGPGSTLVFEVELLEIVK